MKLRPGGLAWAAALLVLIPTCTSSPPMTAVSSQPAATSTEATRSPLPKSTATETLAIASAIRVQVAATPPDGTPVTLLPTALIALTPALPVVDNSGTALPVAIPNPPSRDLIDLQRRLGSPGGVGSSPIATPGPPLGVGTEDKFWVANQQSKNYFQMGARLTLVSEHVYWYVQDGVSVPAGDLQTVASYFETQTYPLEHRLFGSEWTPGIDNDVHIVILIGHIPGVGGYFSSADEYPVGVNSYSNRHEMVYINVDSVRPGSAGFNGTVAHEFMHMIQFNVHRDQNSWINEGSAELAAQAVTGAASSGVHAFERSPQTQLNAWTTDPAGSLAHYGEAYLFMRYVAEQFGGFEAVGRVIRSPGRDIESFSSFLSTLQPPRSFDQVFADWVAANYLEDTSLGKGQFGYKGLQLHPPLVPGPGLGQAIHGTANQLGVSYYKVATDVASHLKFSGAPKVQLIGGDPHLANSEWWSNHGDSIDSRLSRSFDLTGISKASLHFWTWFDIESGFDYAYVEASTDNGRTWTTLKATDTTTANPNGQNYGNGFTGESGGKMPSWIAETADLGPFVGKRIDIRFEYVTDDSFNADGFVVDNVEIPEIGFHDQVSDDGGWTADGFLRTANRIPQRYLFEALDPHDASPARLTAVAGDGSATLDLPAGAVVVVAIGGLTAETTHSSPFTLSLTPR